MEQGQVDRSEVLLSEAVKACPSNPDAHRAYADVLWNRGQHAEAETQLKEALRLDPQDATLWVRMAEMRLALNQPEPALDAAQRAIDIDPKLASAWAARARIYRATSQYPQALADYHRALAYSPGDKTVEWELAELYRETNQPQRALVILQTLSDHYTPGEEPQKVLYSQGVILLSLGRPSDAVDLLSAAATRDKPTPEILYRLAEAQWETGSTSDALATAQKALALDPNHEPSRHLLDRIELADRAGGIIQR